MSALVSRPPPLPGITSHGGMTSDMIAMTSQWSGPAPAMNLVPERVSCRAHGKGLLDTDIGRNFLSGYKNMQFNQSTNERYFSMCQNI